MIIVWASRGGFTYPATVSRGVGASGMGTLSGIRTPRPRSLSAMIADARLIRRSRAPIGYVDAGPLAPGG